MAKITIDELTEIESIDGEADFAIVWDSSSNSTRKIKINKLISTSDVGSGNSAPVIIRGQLGTASSMYKIIKNTINLTRKQDSKTKTISLNNMFAQDSAVFGRLDDNTNIVKIPGENTVFINDTSVSVGGASKNVTLDGRFHYSKGGDRNYIVNVTCSINSITLTTGSYMNWAFQVFV